MSLLKRTVWIIGLLILLAVTKFVLNRISPASVVFHRNLVTGLQWLLFLGLLWWLLLQAIARISRKKNFPFWLSWVIFLVLLGIGEWGVYYLMEHADRVSKRTHGHLLKYYLLFERQLPEVMPDCAQYDPQLTYVYRPNVNAVQEAPEFAEPLHFNNAGLRDDNASLSKPRVICLGDSYTVGVGASQDGTYPQVLEKQTGLKVLNAGVSSYGTVRELMLYRRLDTSALQYLVVQYCFNDLEENVSYLNKGRKLNVRSRQAYDTLVNDHYWATKYFPLKRILTITRMMVKGMLSRNTPEASRPNPRVSAIAANAFLDILYHSGIDFNNVKVLVVDISKYPTFDPPRVAQSAAYSDAFKNSVRFIDMKSLDDPSLFYPLDNHLNEKGHAVLASLIQQEILHDQQAVR